MSEPPLLERIGVEYIKNLARGVRVVDEDGVHVLNDRELASLRSISRGTVLRAVLAGALSAVASAGAEVWANQLYGTSPVEPSAQLRWWGIVVGATAAASVVEIGFLYWDSLRSVHRLAAEAGLDLFDDKDEAREAVAAALARAALELPNPPRGLYGVDATREASQAELILASVLYKMKTSLSNFLLKALLRRALGRTALRTYLQTLLPFVAVPVTALWNGVVAWLVVREARLRVLGPSAAHQLARLCLGESTLPPAMASAAAQAVACSVVKSADFHPNLAALLQEVVGLVGEPPPGTLGDTRVLLDAIDALPLPEALPVLRLLCVAAVIDGKLHRSELALLDLAFARHELRVDLGALHHLRRLLLRGKPIDAPVIEALAGAPPA